MVIITVYKPQGPNGHYASNLTKEFLKDYFSNWDTYFPRKKSKRRSFELPEKTNEESIYLKMKENDFEIVRNSFKLAEASLRECKYEMNFSGTTCILLIVISKED